MARTSPAPIATRRETGGACRLSDGRPNQQFTPERLQPGGVLGQVQALDRYPASDALRSHRLVVPGGEGLARHLGLALAHAALEEGPDTSGDLSAFLRPGQRLPFQHQAAPYQNSPAALQGPAVGRLAVIGKMAFSVWLSRATSLRTRRPRWRLGAIDRARRRQDAVLRIARQIPARQEDRDIRALGRPRRNEEEEDLVVVRKESFDLADDDAVVVRRLVAAVAAPLNEIFPDPMTAEQVRLQVQHPLQQVLPWFAGYRR